MPEVQTQIAEQTQLLLTSTLEPDLQIGVLPAEGGIVLQIVSGTTETMYFDRSSIRSVTLQILCKDTQRSAVDRVAACCNLLQSLTEFDANDDYQMIGYEIDTDPQFVSFESPGGMAIYTAVVRARYYVRK